ncbi:MAG: hypothetical protein M3463_02580 [Verrucomicrobiota bacterium]|nr:hypothetical protein [Verrucomicrobiota bacterium]
MNFYLTKGPYIGSVTPTLDFDLGSIAARLKAPPTPVPSARNWRLELIREADALLIGVRSRRVVKLGRQDGRELWMRVLA